MKESCRLLCSFDDQIQDCTITLIESDTDDDVAIEFRVNDIVIIQNDVTFFEALVKIRIKLEQNGIKLFCQGCRKNVYPSPMMLAMGSGDKAYVLTLGRQAKMSDMVSIFEKCEFEEYATVKEQRAFYEKWIKSL